MSRNSDPLPKEELTPDEFLALCERSKRGEIHMSHWGPGSRPSYWRVRYTENGKVVHHKAEREIDLGLASVPAQTWPPLTRRPYGQWATRPQRSHFK
jgi:hypothetical protein